MALSGFVGIYALIFFGFCWRSLRVCYVFLHGFPRRSSVLAGLLEEFSAFLGFLELHKCSEVAFGLHSLFFLMVP